MFQAAKHCRVQEQPNTVKRTHETMAATMTNPFVATMDARRLGENGAPELSAAGVGEPLVALFFKLVRNLPKHRSKS